MKMLAVSIAMMFGLNINATADTVHAKGVRTRNGQTIQFDLVMNGNNLGSCLHGPFERQCTAVYWNGTWSGTWGSESLTNFQNGSAYREYFYYQDSKSQKRYLRINDCGPYVGQCSYFWIGTLNPQSGTYEGQISYENETFGWMKISVE